MRPERRRGPVGEDGENRASSRGVQREEHAFEGPAATRAHRLTRNDEGAPGRIKAAPPARSGQAWHWGRKPTTASGGAQRSPQGPPWCPKRPHSRVGRRPPASRGAPKGPPRPRRRPRNILRAHPGDRRGPPPRRERATPRQRRRSAGRGPGERKKEAGRGRAGGERRRQVLTDRPAPLCRAPPPGRYGSRASAARQERGEGGRARARSEAPRGGVPLSGRVWARAPASGDATNPHRGGKPRPGRTTALRLERTITEVRLYLLAQCGALPERSQCDCSLYHLLAR